MSDKYVNNTGLSYFYDRIKNIFATQDALDALDDRVDDIVAEGGEPNVIETVKVNGTALTPDANKAVDVTVPTVDNILEYAEDAISVSIESEATDSIASKEYVMNNGGKIDKIKVNGTEQTITNKEVDITVPTKTSDLTNDSDFQTDTQVSTAITTALANRGDPYQTEIEVDTKISTAVTRAYKYQGSVATVNDLPASGNTTGDVYDVQATGMNYAWNGTSWDSLGQYVDTSVLWTSTVGQSNSLIAMTTAEIDTIIDGE